jgi:hypothetical protein
MNKNVLTLVIAFFCLLYFPVSAQEFASIEKNKNAQAQQLYHELNVTKDTLLLKSDTKINYVYSINRNYEKEVYDFINATSYQVPLTKLTKGKHTFVVGQSPLKIVFVVRINGDATTASTSEETSEVMKVTSSH